MSVVERFDADGPVALAYRMAGYIADPAYIASYVRREYGRSPPIDKIKSMQDLHRRQRDEFRRVAEAGCGYSAENDNGEAFRPRGLIRPAKPKQQPPRKVIRLVDRRLPVLARNRQKHAALRNAKAVRAGPIAHSIICAVGEYFGLTPDQIVGSSRKHYIVTARFVTIRLLAEVKDSKGEPRFSMVQIGRIVGGRDHSTIIYAVDSFNDRARKYGAMTEAYEALRDA